MDGISKLLIGSVITLALFVAPASYGHASDSPDSVKLDALANMYEPVSFNHAMHNDVTANECATCHHHTTGTPPVDASCARCHKNSGPADVVACRDCHSEKRFEAEYLKKLEENTTLYHTQKPGLKGAYHLKCMGCHEKMGAPNGCQDCHGRNDAGDKTFRSGKYAPPKGKASSHGGGH